MKCCDRDCETPFCPLCGKRVKPEHPFVSLLAHLKHSLHFIKTSWGNRKKRLLLRAKREQPQRKASQEEIAAELAKAKNHEVVCQKWESWIAAVEEALEQLDDSSPPVVD